MGGRCWEVKFKGQLRNKTGLLTQRPRRGTQRDAEKERGLNIEYRTKKVE